MSSQGDSLIGQTIAQYRILDQIGKGGMGVVYRAQDTSLERMVALKFLPPWMTADSDAEKRFVHEAKASSALDHPNIGTIYEVGRSEKGQLFIAMAFYDGRTVETIIEEDGQVPLEDAVDIAGQIASGLDRAHEEGIIHRDIKPGNVIVTSRGLVKILDFGLAKMQDVTMTMGGVSLGTVAYMAPEQARNDTIDNRTDLWALGVVLYEMLAGRRPFGAGYEAAILYAAANEPHTGVQVHREDVPDWLSTVIDRLLEKDPARRFQSAAEVVKALKAGADGDRPPAAPADPPGSAPVPIGPISGHYDPISGQFHPAPGPGGMSGAFPPGMQSGAYEPGMQSGAYGGMPSGAFGPGMQSGTWPLQPEPRSRALLWGGGAALAVLIIAVIGWGVGKFSSAPNTTQITAEARSKAREMNNRAIAYRSNRQFALAQAEVEQALSLDSTYSTAWTTLASIDIALRNYEAAVEHSRRAVRLEEGNAVAWYNLAYSLEELGRFEEAVATYRDAIARDSSFVQAYSALGARLTELGRVEEGLQVLQRGLAVPGGDTYHRLFLNTGKAMLAQNRNQEAVSALEQSVRLDPTFAESLSLLATAYEATGQRALARDYLERYIAVETDPAKLRAAREKLGG